MKYFGIDFVDGYDACWFLLNEVTSTIPLSEEPNDIEPLIRSFSILKPVGQQAADHHQASLD